MKLQLVLFTMGQLTACLPSGKMEWADLGLEGKEYEGLELEMTLVNHPHHSPYVYIGLGAATVRVRVYTVTGAVDISYYYNAKVAISQGTRLLLTCDATGFSEGNEVVSYRWYHNNTLDTRGYQAKTNIQDRGPYYRVVKDTLLVDFTSLDQGGRYSCFVKLRNGAKSTGITALLTVAS